MAVTEPDNVQWRTDYGFFLARSGDHEAAVAELKKVVAIPGYKDAAGFVNLGYAYRNMKPPRTQDSVLAYQKALELDPKEEQAALGLGWAYMTAQRYEDSIAAYNQAMQIEPKLAGDAYNGIAWTYFFKKDLTQARAYAARAKEAGRPNTLLVREIDGLDKAMAAGAAATERALEAAKQAQAQANAINEGLRSKNPGARMRSARDLAASGSPDAVVILTSLLVHDPDWGVKQACCVLLGNFGAAARSAAEYVRQYTDRAATSSSRPRRRWRRA